MMEKIVTSPRRTLFAAAVGACMAIASTSLWAADAKTKNWAAPAHKMYGQTLVDYQMAKHKELLSVTLHGTPPGEKDIYTMFAGSFPERIGNPDDADDIDVIKKGITILDPRWKRVNDKDKKFVVLLPMRDVKGDNIGLVVYAFKSPPKTVGMEEFYLKASNKLRDELGRKIASYDGLFAAVK